MNDFLPSLVSIKREYLPKSTKTHQIFHAISRSQKNPRREKCQTGIYAENSKLKYGEGGIRTLGGLLHASFQD